MWTVGVTIVLGHRHRCARHRGDPSALGEHEPRSVARRSTPRRPVSSGLFIAQFAVGVLGVLVISAEYSTGTIRATFSAAPNEVQGLRAPRSSSSECSPSSSPSSRRSSRSSSVSSSCRRRRRTPRSRAPGPFAPSSGAASSCACLGTDGAGTGDDHPSHGRRHQCLRRDTPDPSDHRAGAPAVDLAGRTPVHARPYRRQTIITTKGASSQVVLPVGRNARPRALRGGDCLIIGNSMLETSRRLIVRSSGDRVIQRITTGVTLFNIARRR